MGKVEKLSIALTPEFATEVRQAIESGEYASVSEVVRDALRAWRQKRKENERAVADLRSLWREGIESGGWEPLDVEDIKRRGRERLSKAISD
jgi:antitoxin ParD1/3/4